MKALIPAEVIERKIYLIRGHKVMLDSDLAELYGVATKVLLQAVKRNLKRFPEDFMFLLKYQDVAALRSQIVTGSVGDIVMQKLRLKEDVTERIDFGKLFKDFHKLAKGYVGRRL